MSEYAYLEKVDLTMIPYQYNSAAWQSLSFFESYYSNYIEGTKFTLDEAEVIISTGEASYQRRILLIQMVPQGDAC